MAREKEITITIDEFGGVAAETKGIKGPSCVQDVEKLLPTGKGEYEVRKTDEFY